MEDVADEAHSLELDEDGRCQLFEQQKRADGGCRRPSGASTTRSTSSDLMAKVADEDLGLFHPSAAESMMPLIQARLRQCDELSERITPSKVIQNWPIGLEEWSTKAFRDAVYASRSFLD
jgi:hypothetical protein